MILILQFSCQWGTYDCTYYDFGLECSVVSGRKWWENIARWINWVGVLACEIPPLNSSISHYTLLMIKAGFGAMKNWCNSSKVHLQFGELWILMRTPILKSHKNKTTKFILLYLNMIWLKWIWQFFYVFIFLLAANKHCRYVGWGSGVC